MANLIIKSSADNLVLQGSDASPAITVGATGTLTFAENVTMSGTANVLGTINPTGPTFPAGHIIQTKGDTYAPSGSVDITTTASRVLSTNLEVAITCNSTSNYLLLNAFLPNWTNKGTQYANLKYGFQYSTDNWSSETKLGTTYINTAEGYFSASNTLQMSIRPYLWVQVPTVSAMKVQLELGSDTATTGLFWNANTDQQVATFTIQEVQQ